MKKLTSVATGAVSSLLYSVGTALALSDSGNDITGISTSTPTEASIKNIIIDAVEFVLNFVLLIATIYVIVAGIRLIVSGGDEGEKDKAKQTIIYVIIGIIVVLFAKVIVGFANNFFTGTV